MTGSWRQRHFCTNNYRRGPICEAVGLFVPLTHCPRITLHCHHSPCVSPANGARVRTSKTCQHVTGAGAQLEAPLILDGEHQDPLVGHEAEEEGHGLVLVRGIRVEDTGGHDGACHLVEDEHVDSAASMRLSITVDLK